MNANPDNLGGIDLLGNEGCSLGPWPLGGSRKSQSVWGYRVFHKAIKILCCVVCDPIDADFSLHQHISKCIPFTKILYSH